MTGQEEAAAAPGGARLGRWLRDAAGRERVMGWLAWTAPLAVYAALTPLAYTTGDGPELLVAIINQGVAHPSGYPLLTLLGQAVAHVPALTPHYLVTLALCGAPSALTAGLMYRALRLLDARAPVALWTAWIYAFNWRVLYHSTRVEVYALHGLLMALALVMLARWRPPTQARGPLIAATGAVCLGLTNHLTSALMIAPVVLYGALTLGKRLLSARLLLALLGVAAACASLYLYLPLRAAALDGETVAWNDPQTAARFWHHVTGAEYAIFRKALAPLDGAVAVGGDMEGVLFPGVLLLGLLGLIELARTRWRLALASGLFAGSVVVYVSGYKIGDIATYYPPVYWVTLLYAGLGAEWVLARRFAPAPGGWGRRGQAAAWVALFALPVGLAAQNHTVRYLGGHAQAMGEQVTALVGPGAIVFTEVDQHTFPMWYQAYVARPELGLVAVDRVMFGLENKQWYRDFLRARHPDVVWPDDATATGGGSWEYELIKANQATRPAYALLWNPWREPGTRPLNRGWALELVPSGRAALIGGGHDEIRHVYLAYHRAPFGGHHFTGFSADNTFVAGEDALACVVEWMPHVTRTGTWRFTGPEGAALTIGPHEVPPASNLSWEYLPVDQQAPGAWRCEVTFAGKAPLVIDFTLTP